MNKKKFDRQQVLESAMQLFWQKGYHATSTRDLQQVTSLQPGSLYAAFKNKKMLFSEALHCYVSCTQKDFESCRTHQENPLEALKAFTLYTLTQKATASHLCFLYKSSIEFDGSELQEISQRLSQEVQSWFLQIFIEAQSKKLLNASHSPEFLVKKFQMHLLGWRAYLSLNQDEDFVRESIEEFFTTQL